MAIRLLKGFLIGSAGAVVTALGTMIVTTPNATASFLHHDYNATPPTAAPLTAQRWLTSLIAYYPLRNNANDATGKAGAMTLVNAPFQDGGVYCNGVYIYSNSSNPCNVITPQLEKFNFNSFSIGAKFKVSQYDTRPVFVGGNSYRWVGFYLSSDGKITLKYNNSNRVTCNNVKYQLNTWHKALITYDGNVGKLYLDGVLGCSTAFKIQQGNDKNIGVTDFSNGLVFKGVLKDLTIYNRVIKPFL